MSILESNTSQQHQKRVNAILVDNSKLTNLQVKKPTGYQSQSQLLENPESEYAIKRADPGEEEPQFIIQGFMSPPQQKNSSSKTKRDSEGRLVALTTSISRALQA